jgi:hypothetical protein
MSVIVEFFRAPDEEPAVLVLPTGPGRAFALFENFGPWDAVVERESLFTGRAVEDLQPLPHNRKLVRGYRRSNVASYR